MVVGLPYSIGFAGRINQGKGKNKHAFGYWV
jgi:hypothetical protein